MTDACNASDATLWTTAAAASAELVRAAHRRELLGGRVDVQEALASHIAVAVKQLDRMPSAASACSHMFVALADVDIRLLEPWAPADCWSMHCGQAITTMWPVLDALHAMSSPHTETFARCQHC
jgi:hypothetical protein